jgi:hypothetical protein
MKKHHKPVPEGYRLVFARFRKDPRTGQVLDAHVYGYKAWPLIVPIENPEPLDEPDLN